ncbi:FAD-dependent oxidoreductase [Dietzia sp. PP-33]|jgi:ferredoxin--NADP+ reductase|uniref:FAD-dependent oxidoreductase n=1 Tax=Dietzia sp. PP-33 TaxID=2957500 RepID=UPI0029B0CEF9|nr:FAD-dependent oxidoreductase [Dietzia sp. PP-33]MDX2356190.1 pyridine nucleotide-disulfide oxidoreductase [Dietzia sp. PP-33]
MTTSSDSALRVAVVGSGPAGVYACEALLDWSDSRDPSGRGIVVDLFDRLPVPYGLLRHGVAPDHPRIKGIARTLEGIAADPRIRFLGNVEFGTDLTLEDMRGLYHAVVFSTGALADRLLNIPGEDLEGSHGAAEFVTWYDGHPDSDPEWVLTAERAAVLGVGNVALDVARMLVRSAEQLEATDIPDHVRSGFGTNASRVVSVIGRRGPAYAKFTPLELREMGKVEGLTVVVDPADLEYDDEARELREHDRRVGQICDQLEKWAGAQREAGHGSADQAEAAALDAGGRVVRFRFHRSPARILGTDGRVSGLRLELTEPDGPRVRSTGRTEDLQVEAVYRAVGYRSAPLEGLPFDPGSAVIPNDSGRILDSPDGDPLPGLYTAGWVKRGPTGVIGTNRSCAVETIGRLTADLDSGALNEPTHPDPPAVLDLLAERGVAVVDGAAWTAIDTHERELGAAAGRERTKLPGRAEMLDIGLNPRPASR